jgi:2-succinyl-6-hydroxy-2,4-cyclohexadiene-1-carboxylate synthase
MKIQFENFALNVNEFYSKNNSSINIFLLHGFTGSAEDWNFIIPSLQTKYNLFAIDLIGHGKSDSPTDVYYYSPASISLILNKIILHFNGKKNILLGYSMGGRAALTYASKYPDNLAALILESSTAGISNLKEREERRIIDGKLADTIKCGVLESFVDYWMSLDLFSSQKNLSNNIIDKIRKDKLKNNKTGLANSLLGFGTGSMPPLFNDLKNISIKTLLITGILDPKFSAINSSLVKLFPDAQHVVINNAGHNTHLEQPKIFTDVIIKFLNELHFF